MKKRKQNIFHIGSIILVALFVCWVLVPIVMVILQSIKPRIAIFTIPPTLIFKPTSMNFENALAKQNIGRFLINSLIIGSITTVVCTMLGSIAAYSLARFKIKGANFITILILITRIVPGTALLVPMFSFMNQTGMLKVPYLSVIIAHTAFNLPFTICMLRSFFAEIPKDLENAAIIDGCTRMQSFYKVALPLVAPGLTATAILTLLSSWNEFMFALVLTDRTTRTLPVGISSFLGSVSTDWGGSSAAAVIAMVPIFIAGLLVQKYLVRGMTMGAVKG